MFIYKQFIKPIDTKKQKSGGFNYKQYRSEQNGRIVKYQQQKE